MQHKNNFGFNLVSIVATFRVYIPATENQQKHLFIAPLPFFAGAAGLTQ